MTSNLERAMILARALRAAIDEDRDTLRASFTDDVRAWTPALSTTSLRALIDALDRRDDAFSDIALDVVPLDVGGDRACVEWSVEMTHTGIVTLPDDRHLDPTGVRVTLHGVTIAEFHGDRICSLRQYWDEVAVLEQLGALAGHDEADAALPATPFDMWELRWIAADLPSLDEVWLPRASLDPALRVIYEHDVYLLAPSDRINLKVRHRANSLKLKRLAERTAEGFERWRTEFEAPLPAGPEHFRDVLSLIGRAGPPGQLGAAASAGEVVEMLDAISDPPQLVAVHKSRRQFRRGTCGVDEVRFRTLGGTFRSLGIESSNLDDLRSLVPNLAQDALGSPRNYTEFLAAAR
jgi:hypothetical protein